MSVHGSDVRKFPSFPRTRGAPTKWVCSSRGPAGPPALLDPRFRGDDGIGPDRLAKTWPKSSWEAVRNLLPSLLRHSRAHEVGLLIQRALQAVGSPASWSLPAEIASRSHRSLDARFRGHDGGFRAQSSSPRDAGCRTASESGREPGPSVPVPPRFLVRADALPEPEILAGLVSDASGRERRERTQPRKDPATTPITPRNRTL
jgi:hypothetical protein